MMNRVNTNTEELRGELDRLAQSALDSALNSLFNEIEKKLFTRADHTSNQHDKSELFEKIAQLKNNRNNFEDTLYSVITESNPILNQINWASLVQNRSLALQMEDMIAHAKAKFGIEHAQYESRIKSLNLTDEECFPKHLYTVSSITYGFIKASGLFQSDIRDNLIRSLGTNVLYKLEPLYILLNDLLIQSGVIPEVKSKRTPQRSELESLIDAISNSESLIEEQLTEHTRISSEEIQSFLKSSVDNKDIFLQSKSSWSPKNLIESIVGHFRKSHPSLLSKIELHYHDREIITLAGAILSDLINNDDINPIIKNQAIALQTIILHTAFTDIDFFSNLKNPAREVLSKLAMLGSDPYLGTDDLEKIANSVKSFIRSTTSKTTPAFDALSRELDTIENSEIHHAKNSQTDKYPLNTSVTVRSRNRVTFIINSAIGAASLPVEASDFLKNVLNPFMVHVLMTYGRQCAEWKEALAVLDAVIQLEVSGANDIRDTLIVESKVKELIKHPVFGDNFFKVAAQKTATDNYFSHLKDKRAQLSLIQQSPEEEREAPSTSRRQHQPSAEPVVEQVERAEPEAKASSGTASPLTHEDADEVSAERPDERSTESEEAKPDAAVPVEETKQPEPSPYDQLCTDPRIKQFLDRHILNNEWLQIYTSDDAALRRLKASKVNMELKIVSFANRNGEITLVLPIAQFVSDLFENRSNPVFDNPNYNSAKQQLLDTFKSEGLV
ncbi:MAG: hypothetical protein B7X35_00440 [Halothiobacillus sp. 14-56-357]|jgi:hypothetical protein|uniref:DUF1631 family protein n=1 Tax=Halothiobacillus sp. 15-55-196 TaxID=1970382 RepID=UPI000BC6B90C|nr:DUF1631 family protein [Halothiobacillus sp. 15-55-196]OZB37733.1 MAG: hypothetical protein B7X44_00025 [Halothiobacillus sp. 15-55-196]OZB57647.1 MAG: hypothetical protein B7X35_00440 [Halothiobacillus sp. 14-56-357]OZB84301.1 MAG: hypothetical protein B7X28_00680 [Halothiobacillus sp. 13-55-253]